MGWLEGWAAVLPRRDAPKAPLKGPSFSLSDEEEPRRTANRTEPNSRRTETPGNAPCANRIEPNGTAYFLFFGFTSEQHILMSGLQFSDELRLAMSERLQRSMPELLIFPTTGRLA